MRYFFYQYDSCIHECYNSSHSNCDEQGGETALMGAAHNGHHECLSILVANGADVNMASKVPMEMMSFVLYFKG